MIRAPSQLSSCVGQKAVHRSSSEQRQAHPMFRRFIQSSVAQTFVAPHRPLLPNTPPHKPPSVSRAPRMAVTPPKSPKSFYRRQLPANLTDFTTPQGKNLFHHSLRQGNAEAFFPLVSQLQTQSHPALCGLTTLAVVLNALAVDPKRVWAHPWRWFTETLLDCCLDLAVVKAAGVTMDQLARTARCQGTQVSVVREMSLEDARALIKRSVRGNGDGTFEFVVASYDRRTLGQTGTGHFSPIAAYDEESDSVLVLDVARFKYGPYWVSLEELVSATKPIDPSAGLSRGFMAIRKKNGDEPDEGCHVTDCRTTATCT